MSVRHCLSTSILAAVLTGSIAFPAFGQAVPAGGETTANYQITGSVNADKVYVRSGAGENDYPVMRLNKGDQVTVLGEKFEWLKILPPPGAYCVIGKAFVERRGEGGKIGRVINADNMVKIGSQLNDIKAKVVGKLEVGADVQVIEEQNEFLKIVPPAGTVLYINKRFVDPVKRADVPPVDPTTPPEKKGIVAGPAASGPERPMSPDDTTPKLPAANESSQPTTGPAVVDGPTTAPAGSAEAEFERVEHDMYEAVQRPMNEQPIDTLTARYQKLLGDKNLPSSVLTLCEVRIADLKVRAATLVQFKDMEAARTAKAQEMAPMKAEGDELAQRVKDSQLKRYVAVGTLRASSLQIGGKPLFRLTDPATGRTVVYVRTEDAAVLAKIGSFIGIAGEVTNDTRLKIKYVMPTTAEDLQPSAVTSGAVISGMTPASLVPSVAPAK